MIFFTDRSLYRPGQTIRFKGIALRVNTATDKYDLIANSDYDVVFSDVNGKEIASRNLKTNAFGSIEGDFTAPRDRLGGQMKIHAEHLNGEALIRVEEYKRPKFSVALDAPKDNSKLNAKVKVSGRAVAYNGVPISGAKVSYRVDRLSREFPSYMEAAWLEETKLTLGDQIARGKTSSEADGSFAINFTAKPNRDISETMDTCYRFKVIVDVTDSAGETRSDSKIIAIGYTSLQAKVTIAEWQTADRAVKLDLALTTRDGIGQKQNGTVKIYHLKQPQKVLKPWHNDRISIDSSVKRPDAEHEEEALPLSVRTKPRPSWPVYWESGEVAYTTAFQTDASGKATVEAKLPAGIYRIVVDAEDPAGGLATAKEYLQVLDPAAKHLNIKVPNIVASPSWTVEPGNDFTLFWGTGYESGRAFIEFEHRGKIVKSFWTEPGQTQSTIKFPVTEAMRGGFTVHTTFVHENQAYLKSQKVEVPWSNKKLTVKWERFRSKLLPGQKEKFTAVISGPDAKKAVAEMVATLYDQSLDAYKPHQWPQLFDIFRTDETSRQRFFENEANYCEDIPPLPVVNPPTMFHSYRSITAALDVDQTRYQLHTYEDDFQRRSRLGYSIIGFGAGFGGGLGGIGGGLGGIGGGGGFGGEVPGLGGNPFFAPGRQPPSLPNLKTIAPRKNLNETAFFFPQLVSDSDGVIRMEFTMPEALTKWKFLGFAHDKELRSGFLTDSVVTAKDLMVQPNPPRFLREGDTLEFPVKVSNQSVTRQNGRVRFSLKDAVSDRALDGDYQLASPELGFDLAAGESKTFTWPMIVPASNGPVVFKVVAASEQLSDGEEGVIPVLSDKVLVAESLPLPIRGPGTKEFEFAHLKQSANSNTIRHQSYTVQMVSQPAWYALLALPYLMEYQHECSEQLFNRLYANSLGQHIARSDPKIRKVFDQWQGTGVLDSPMEKNQDLKSVLIEETPWVRHAVRETQSRKNLGVLFDEARMKEEIDGAIQKLAARQYPDGSLPWYPGGLPNEYMTLYVTTGFGRLRHLGVNIDTVVASKAIGWLDSWAIKNCRGFMERGKPDDNYLSPSVALYLYGRSFFLADHPLNPQQRVVVDFWLDQARKHWVKVPNRQSQSHLALALKRFGDNETAGKIMASLKERSVSNEEMGMFWRDQELQQWWYHAPIETQAMMVEAFDEITKDLKAVEDCKIWLLKQKQTQNWCSTKATADAVYALLLRGDNLLKSDALVEVTVGNQLIVPEKVEAGTGFFEKKFIRSEVTPSLGTISLKKVDPGVSWGSVHWQYLETIDKVEPHRDGPLKLEKRLFKRTLTKADAVIEPLAKEPLAVGDEVVVRVVLRSDRDMEYLHLKDHRGSGTEPVNVLSQYKYQDGLRYYESTKDSATHFFIDYLPKGTYVFEYPVRVQLRGSYSTGYANIKCMYAPEFNSHSESIRLEVK